MELRMCSLIILDLNRIKTPKSQSAELMYQPKWLILILLWSYFLVLDLVKVAGLIPPTKRGTSHMRWDRNGESWNRISPLYIVQLSKHHIFVMRKD